MNRPDHARVCKVCGERFPNAWGGVGLAKHYWMEHGIPSYSGFNGKWVSFGPEGKKIDGVLVDEQT